MSARSGIEVAADCHAQRWVFGYGSLMWRPGFPIIDRQPALLKGYHRAFCRMSFRHRGTPEQPGMVVGLSPGGACRGIAFMPHPERNGETLDYLDEREGAGYKRIVVSLNLETALETAPGSRVEEAWVYVPDDGHPTHRPNLSRKRMVELIATGVGMSGNARDYLAQLIAQLNEMNAGEPELEDMLKSVDRYRDSLGAQSPPETAQER